MEGGVERNEASSRVEQHGDNISRPESKAGEIPRLPEGFAQQQQTKRALRRYERAKLNVAHPNDLFLYARLFGLVYQRVKANEGFTVPRPTTRVSPPERSASLIIPGMSPEGIEDPSLRKQYEEAISVNDQRAAFWQWQWTLQQLQTELAGAMATCAANLYTNRADRERDLRGDLLAAGINDTTVSAATAFIKERFPVFANGKSECVHE